MSALRLATLCTRVRPAAFLHLHPAVPATPLPCTSVQHRAIVPALSRAMSNKPPKKPSKLVGADITKALGTLRGWTKVSAVRTLLRDKGDESINPDKMRYLFFFFHQLLERDCIVKKFEFEDFNECWGVMCRVALLAEKVSHSKLLGEDAAGNYPRWLTCFGRMLSCSDHSS
jgi:hypothetical protein